MHQKLQTSKKRKIALIVGAGVLAAYLACQVVVLRPRRVSAREKLRTLTRTTSSLHQKGWPLDHTRLRSLLADLSRRSEIAESKRAALMQRVGLPFKEMILRRYETPELFQKQVARLDYQEEFKRLERYLLDNGITIAPEVFKLSEDTVGVENYKLVLQLWTMRTVVETALAKGLTIPLAEFDETLLEEGEKPPEISDLGALAIVPILPAAHIADPYMIRIPVRARFSGTIENVLAFLKESGRGKTFFAVDHLELQKPIPPKVKYDNSIIEAEVECSTFYILDTESGRRMMKAPEIKKLPRGA